MLTTWTFGPAGTTETGPRARTAGRWLIGVPLRSTAFRVVWM